VSSAAPVPSVFFACSALLLQVSGYLDAAVAFNHGRD
jgi:hypothetical protein